MAAINLRIVLDVGGTLTSNTKTISDANITRIVNAHKVLLGVATNQEVLNYFLKRTIDQMVANTKVQESVPGADIPVT